MASDQKYRRPIPQLTGLRFFAAISVAIAHAAAISLRISPESGLQATKHWLEASAGFGMTLFFVLSGFVIHYNYAYRLTFSGLRGASEFFWARFSRLYPLYFIVLLIEFMSSDLISSYVSTGATADRYEAIPAYLTLSQSWGYKIIGNASLVYAFGSVVPVTWSISTEWFFYLFYPAILPFVGRLKSSKSSLIAVLVWSAVWATVMVTASDLSPRWLSWASEKYGYVATSGDDSFARWALYFSPYARIGEFILGTIVAQLLTMLDGKPLTGFEKRFGVVFSVLSVLIVIPVLYLMYAIDGTSWIRQLNNNFGLAVPIALLIFCAVRYDTFLSWICSRRWAVFLGEASYSIYLIHFFVYIPFMSRVPEPLPAGIYSVMFLMARLVLMVALVLVVASATYRLIELPAREYLRRARFDGITTRFAGPAALVPVLGAGSLWLVLFAPVSVSHSDVKDAIFVRQATYGKNCGAMDGNVTRQVAKTCTGKKQCDYIVDVRNLGDPAANCGKDFTVNFSCGGDTAPHRVELPGEAGLGSHASLSCEPGMLTSAPPSPVSAPPSETKDAINVMQATYGKNCGAVDGNVTRQVAKSCTGKKECNYIVDVRNLGDPAPNCGKDFTVNFNCGDDAASHRVELPGEAGLGSLASLSCGSAIPK